MTATMTISSESSRYNTPCGNPAARRTWPPRPFLPPPAGERRRASSQIFPGVLDDFVCGARTDPALSVCLIPSLGFHEPLVLGVDVLARVEAVQKLFGERGSIALGQLQNFLFDLGQASRHSRHLRNVPDSTPRRSIHDSFRTYQPTVFVRPLSKVSFGCQPSSRRILAMLMA